MLMQRDFQLPHYTVHDYNQWQGDWELINGYPFAMSPSPLPKHQIAGRKILKYLSIALDNQKKSGCDCEILYETDWKISEDTIVRPNIMVICGAFNPNELITIVPSLIVEIFSPAIRLKDRNLKFNLYQQAGVKYYLMADPDAQTIESFELLNNSYAETKEALQFTVGKSCIFSINANQVFES